MAKLGFVLALFLLVGATKINGQSMKPEKLPANLSSFINFPPNLEPVTPLDVKIEPYFVQPTGSAPPKVKGRLLTPQEGCGYSPIGNSKIVGGGPAKNGAWPWMALLGYRPPAHLAYLGATFNCGGSLITSRHVLTAAHCIMDNLWFARLGEHDVRTTSDGEHQDVLIVEKKQHPQYNKDLLIFDVAMIYLQHDVVFNDRVRTICLPVQEPAKSANLVGQNPFVTGWGITATNGQQSPYLKQVQSPVVDTRICKEIFRRTGVLRSESQINHQVVCAGVQAGQASCQGDSGGPLMMPMRLPGVQHPPFMQIGVVSWGIPCAHPNIPTVYTSTQHFGPWIQSMIR